VTQTAAVAELAFVATAKGTLAIVSAGRQLRASLVIATAEGRSYRASRWRREGSSLVAEAGPFAVGLEYSIAGDGVAFTFSLSRSSGAAHELVTASLTLDTASLIGDVAVPVALRLGYCGAHSRSEVSRSFARPLEHNETLTGWWAGALGGADAVVIGALDFRRFVTSIVYNRASITAVQHLDRRRLTAGEVLQLATLWLATPEGAPLQALESYAMEVGRVHGARPPRPMCGWGSWGHFFEEIDAGLVRETLATLDGIPAVRDAVGVVQIDDGWSELLASGRVSASWRPNRRFPSGIAPLAAEIAATGRDCGLWMIPFTVNDGSALATDHPEFLVRGSDGAPHCVGSANSYCIDPTHARAAEWLLDLFEDVHDWGVRYLKLDFLRALLAFEPVHPHDGLDTPRQYAGGGTRVEAYRRGLEIIRKAMGDSAYLLGCSAPAGPGAGLVSAHRIGPDIQPTWVSDSGGVRDAARAVAANWFWQGRAWVNDPDYVIPCESEDLTRFWATIVALSGGSMILSADLSEMDSWVEDLFAFIVPPIGISARPLDLFENGPDPRLWSLPLSKYGRSWQVAAVFNWSDEPATYTMDLARFGFGDAQVHLWDAWRQRHRLARRSAEVFVEGRSCVLFRMTLASSHPAVVGTDVHYGQGLVEIEDELWDPATRTIRIRAGRRAGNAYVWWPSSFAPSGRASSDGDEHVQRVPLAPGTVSTVTFDTAARRAKTPSRQPRRSASR